MARSWQDVRCGVRILANSPAFSLTTVFSLVLGIGANTAVFGVIYAALIDPYPSAGAIGTPASLHQPGAPTTGEIYSTSVRTSQYVTVRDGTRLAIDIYRPGMGGKPVDKRLPVVLVATPYHRSSENNGEILTFLASQGNHRNIFAEVVEHGYVVASLDIRGRGASFGGSSRVP
jgi:hypothetical protein